MYAWCLVSDSSVHVAPAFGPCPGHAAHGGASAPSHHAEHDAGAIDSGAAQAHATGDCARHGAGQHHGLHVAASDLVAGSVLHATPPPSQRFIPVLRLDFALRPDAAAAGAWRSARHAATHLPHRRIAGAMPGADSRLLI
jgi:hypothetical protein